MIVQLNSEELFRLRGARGARLEALSGVLWVTEQDRAEDACLAVGGQYVVKGDGLVLVGMDAGAGVDAGGRGGRFALAIGDAWRALREALAGAWLAACTARELEELSDAQLKDIGLAREDILRAAGDRYSFFRR